MLLHLARLATGYFRSTPAEAELETVSAPRDEKALALSARPTADRSWVD